MRAFSWALGARYRGVLCGARGADAEVIGFDEGDKPAAWVAGLRRREIEVVEDVGRESAIAALRQYASLEHPLY